MGSSLLSAKPSGAKTAKVFPHSPQEAKQTQFVHQLFGAHEAEEPSLKFEGEHLLYDFLIIFLILLLS